MKNVHRPNNSDRLALLDALGDPNCLPEEQERLTRLAYEWVRTGVFCLREFQRVMDKAYIRGRAEAFQDFAEGGK